MSGESDNLILFLALYLKKKNEKKRKKRTEWCKSWYRRREELSHVTLMNELKAYPSDWRNYMRMSEDIFLELLKLVDPYIRKEDTQMRQSISPYERLSATLRFLATGMSYEELKYPTTISPPSLSNIIPETCKSIIKSLHDYIKMPETEEEWKNVAKGFESHWQFPNCVGAIDGKHIRIVPPPGSGSYYYNYKKFHSVVLMACANSEYEFVWCEVGCNGRISDGGVIKGTIFYEKLINGDIKLPQPRIVDGVLLPYVFIGDEAFALREDFLKPFSQSTLNAQRRIYNYRLSRARRLIENVFGIITNRFRILAGAINLPVEKIDIIILTICTLHNFLRKKIPDYISAEDELDEEYPNALTGLQGSQLARNPPTNAKAVRETYSEYFNNQGAVDWMNQYALEN